jgi:putative redox protein
MKIKLARIESPMHFRAQNEMGMTVDMDAKPAAGGKGDGMGPMENLIASLGGCSSIDIVLLLKKMRQDLQDIQVSIDAERDPAQVPSLFIKIHMHFDLFGILEDKSVRKAIELSVDKYCSVAQILKKTVPITFSYTIHS